MAAVAELEQCAGEALDPLLDALTHLQLAAGQRAGDLGVRPGVALGEAPDGFEASKVAGLGQDREREDGPNPGKCLHRT